MTHSTDPYVTIRREDLHGLIKAVNYGEHLAYVAKVNAEFPSDWHHERLMTAIEEFTEVLNTTIGRPNWE